MSPNQVATQKAVSFVDKLNELIIYPTIALLSAIALLIFLWGTAQYFINATNDQARQQGARHMLWGVVGLVIMLSAYSILSIAAGTFGLNDELKCADDPNGPGCDTVFTVPNPNPTPPGQEVTPTPTPPGQEVTPTPTPPGD